MKRKCIGFDIGARTVHVAVCDGGVGRVLDAPAPEGLVRDGQILSYEAMAEFLKDLRKREKLRIKKAALVLPSGQCYCRRFTTAYMTDEQLKFNLPYEFRDYLSGAKEEYIYDYAVVETKRDEDGVPREIDLMAAAARKDLMQDLYAVFQRAGFKLLTAVPEELAYINLLRSGGDTAHGHCILDLGHTGVRLYMFNGDRYENVRALDFGCNALVRAVADHYSVDEHVAASYLETDYNGCTGLPQCEDIYNSVAVEVTKAVNFYRFNSGGEELTHLHLGGGGVRIRAMVEAIRRQLTLPVEDMSEFMPGLPPEKLTLAATAAAAVGAALQG